MHLSIGLILLHVVVLFTMVHSFLGCSNPHDPSEFEWDEGGIRRGSKKERQLALAFAASDYAEQTLEYLAILRQYGLKASVFPSGVAVGKYRNLIQKAVDDGHYLGPHSYAQPEPVFCDFNNRNITLVTRDFFVQDIENALQNLSATFGRTRDQMQFWLPPYQLYNNDISNWSHDVGQILWCFTEGTLSDSDFSGEGDPNFKPSQEILQSVIDYEQKDPFGLNGFALFFHLGSDHRTDKFAPYMPALLQYLLAKQYKFITIDELLCTKQS